MVKYPIFLHSLHSVLPRFYGPQRELIDWTLKIHQLNEKAVETPTTRPLKAEVLRRFCLNEGHIKQRYYECEDVNGDPKDHRLYDITEESPKGATILEKNKFFSGRCQEVFREFYEGNMKLPSHVLHVTCTGYVSPSAPQVYFSKIEDAPAISHSYHMGCYASLPSVRMGKALVASGEEAVDVVHTEMCSLHMDPSAHTPEQMVVQSLFADGHIRYQLSSEMKPGLNLEVITIKEKILPDSGEDMTWIPASHGMVMTLSREVPSKIRDSLVPFLQDMCQDAGFSFEVLLKTAIFAIHPGGPKIIESVQKKLEIEDWQVRFSQKVLHERGNMSSATLPHVWKEIIDSDPEEKTLIVSLAFGPGLTIFGGIFEVKKCPC